MNIDEEIEQESRELYPKRDIHRQAFKKGVKWGAALFLTSFGCHLCDEKGIRYQGVLIENGKWVCRLCVDAMIKEDALHKEEQHKSRKLLMDLHSMLTVDEFTPTQFLPYMERMEEILDGPDPDTNEPENIDV